MSTSNLWNAYRATDPYPGGLGADPTGVRDSGPAIAYWLAQAGANGGGIVELAPGDNYRTRRSLVVPAGVNLIGGGKGNTRLLADDSAGNLGSILSCTAARNASVRELYLSALSPRTAGNAVTVSGGDPSDNLTDNLNGSEFVLQNVDMDSQFNGYVVNDAPGSNGCWKAYAEYGSWKNFSSGGIGCWVNSPNGASHFIEKIFFYGPQTANTTAIRIQATGDCTLTANETWGFQHGLLIDPSVTGTVVEAVTVIGGFYDQSTNEALKIAPAALPQQASLLRFSGVWFATGGFGGTGNSATVVGSSANLIQFNGCSFYHATGWGLQVSAAQGVSVVGCIGSLNTLGDINFTGGAIKNLANSNQLFSTSVPGVQFDGGTSENTAVGNAGKNSCITDLSGGVTKTIGLNQ